MSICCSGGYFSLVGAFVLYYTTAQYAAFNIKKNYKAIESHTIKNVCLGLGISRIILNARRKIHFSSLPLILQGFCCKRAKWEFVRSYHFHLIDWTNGLSGLPEQPVILNSSLN